MNRLLEWTLMPPLMLLEGFVIIAGAILMVAWVVFGPIWIYFIFPDYFDSQTWHSITLGILIIWAYLITLYEMGK